jgi:hypothetical protein
MSKGNATGSDYGAATLRHSLYQQAASSAAYNEAEQHMKISTTITRITTILCLTSFILATSEPLVILMVFAVGFANGMQTEMARMDAKR